MKILAIGAHPDDIEIFMYGALAAWKAMGAELAFAIATDGSKGGSASAAKLRKTRTAEAKAAAARLGVTPRFLGFIDGELVPDAPVVAAVRALIASTAPDLIVTHAPNDYHGDHRALSDAVRLAASFKAPVLWADTLQGVGFAPTHYVDVTAHYPLKRKAIGEHGRGRTRASLAGPRLLHRAGRKAERLPGVAGQHARGGHGRSLSLRARQSLRRHSRPAAAGAARATLR